MFKNRVKKANVLRAMFIGLANATFPLVHAEGEGGASTPDDGEGGASGGAPTNPINYEELIARARKEEKDKLYPEIKKLRDDLKAMTKSNNDNLLKVAALEKKLEEAQKQSGSAESETVTKLRAEVERLTGENETLKNSQPNEEAIRAQVKAEYEVQLYKVEQLGKDENKTSILPMFLEGISGTTKEEVDASIQKAKDKTIEAKKQLGVTDTPPASTPTPPAGGGGNTNTPPIVNPSSPTHNDFGSSTDLDYVRKLDPASAEYKEWRKKMGLR